MSPSSPPPDPPKTADPRPAAPNAETLIPQQPRIDTDVPTSDYAAFTAAPPTLIGKIFGDFELVEEIGRGGMGVVFKAKQLSLERTVALKMLLSEHLLDPVRLARFITEARTMAGLDHPNIVHIYQIGRCDFGHFFAMEYIDGQSLDAILKEKQILSLTKAVRLITVIGEAIQHAHAKGVVHRDLKPSNIMIDRIRRPVVMDFGIAKYIGQSSVLTQQGTIMGTPAFMAPEQAGDTLGPVGPPSDVYALGAILYMLLTGKPPYEASTPLATVLKVLEPTPPVPVRELRPDAPAELERIVMKCLAKPQVERFATAAELVEALRRFRAAPATQKVPPIPSRLPHVILTVQKSGKKIRLYKLITLVGRAPECTLLVRTSDVSKHHCQILIDTHMVTVQDLDSANGTYVNGKRIKKARLRDGDELRIADHVLAVRVVEAEG